MRAATSSLLGFLLSLTATSAAAADAAERSIIGFSGDGRWFAFEEFGVDDGTGAAYSSIYVLDVENDEWTPESPVRVSDDESASKALWEIRRETLEQAAPMIEKYATYHPGKSLASNAVGEQVANPRVMVFKRFHNLSQTWTVKLDTIDVPAPPGCANRGPVVGFAVSAGLSDGEIRELARDHSIPRSRGCPLEYRLADVVAFGESETAKTVVLIHVLREGFKGRNARFIALPVDLSSSR